MPEDHLDINRRKEGKCRFFAWNEAFSVGVREIDEQRRRLLELINSLHRVMMEDDENRVFGGG